MRFRNVTQKRSQAAAFAALGMLLLTGSPAVAHGRHHRVIAAHVITLPPAAAAAVPDTGFGPTAPGVSDILIDAGSGKVLAEDGADTPRYPASLTKLMVLDLAFEALRANRMTLNTQIPVSFHAASVEPVKLGLQPGDTLTVEQAILAMTTMSANDAATALGEYLGGGSEYRCGEMMTLRAHSLGMAQTEFFNASGLPNPNQVTTARDLSILARDIVLTYPQFQGFFEAQKFNFNGRMVYSNNQMLKLYPGTTGMKTGYTTLAKHNLITSAQRDGRTLIGIVLHEPSWGASYTQMTAMLDAGFGGASPAITTMAVAQNTAPAAPPFEAPPPAAPLHTGLGLFTSADAASPAHSMTGASGLRLADWTAQIGSYSRLEKARSQAILIAHMRGVGVPRVARLNQRGHVLWTAQLAGLTQSAAYQTCSALAARRTSCVIIAPQSEHMAGREDFNG
jgi:D-alanyl-D-alanine carboxypeptidase